MKTKPKIIFKDNYIIEEYFNLHLVSTEDGREAYLQGVPKLADGVKLEPGLLTTVTGGKVDKLHHEGELWRVKRATPESATQYGIKV